MSRQLAKRSGASLALARDRIVQRLREAERALAVATRLDQAKLIADAAAAHEVFARRQALGDDIIGYAHAIKIHALARLGDLLKAMPKATGTRGQLVNAGPGRGKTGGTKLEPPVSLTPTFADLGIGKKAASVAQALADLPEDTREAIAKGEQTIAEARRVRRRQRQRAVPLPAGKYRVFYADPPWSYGNAGVINDSDGYGRAARHYPSLTIAQLCALDVRALAADNSVLFLWVTSPLLAECWPVIRAWGFEYKTSLVWDKVDHNFGNYVSVRHELLLLCTRGSCLPDHPTPMPDSVITIPRSSTHSRKPEAFRQLIDQLYDGGADQKVELFAREAVEGWTPWGNEVAA
jgi:N6-adenosine-specific RNA methylase IME4